MNEKVSFFCYNGRDSANASPHYQKLCARATPIWGSRRSQPNQSAMEGPLPGGTTFLIAVSPAPGKYETFCLIHCFQRKSLSNCCDAIKIILIERTVN